MKIITLFGTRPEIIRLSRVIKSLDQFCEQLLVHTGQNYDPNLSDIFFHELDVRRPDVHLGIRSGDFAAQVGQILTHVGELLRREQPDRLLILGDTNSGLAAIVAARLGIPVFHMEAGNRCYDNRVPEEVNRRLIDHSSTILMPYTHRSKENLLREGIENERIHVIGNPIYEVLNSYQRQIEASQTLSHFGVEPKGYFLVTMHRSENVDDPQRLERLLAGLSAVAERHRLPMLISVHPRTAAKLNDFGLSPSSERVRLMEPLGFFDFVKLEQHARLVLSDSGTVQEECALFHVPNVTIRDVTERPETVDCGSNILAGSEPEAIQRAADIAMTLPTTWTPPAEYTIPNVSSTVTKILLGYTSLRRHVS